MKKFILSAMAVAAFAVGGAAKADVIDSVGTAISQLFGIPYDATRYGVAPGTTVYTDSYGRPYYLGAYNQPIYIQPNGPGVPYAGNYAVAPSYDRDGDGIENRYDRYPDDARYR